MERFLLQDAVRPGSHLAVSRRHKRSSVGVHWHNYIELELITGGTGWQKLNGQRYELRRGSLCLLRLTDFHEINPDPELHILNLSVEGVKSEILLHFLESQGAYVSSGSACAGGKESHVLKAAGLPPKRIGSALRISFSHLNTPEEAEQLASLLAEGMKKYKGTLR